MPAIDSWLRQPGAQAIGWALVQFVWQGTGVGLLSAFALFALRRSAADVRYVVASIGLALMLTLPIVTGVQKYQALGQEANAGVLPAPVHSAPEAVAFRATEATGESSRQVAPKDATAESGLFDRLRAEPVLPGLMVVWLVGVSLLSLRLLTGWLWAQRLRTRGVTAADETLCRVTARLARRLHIARAVSLLQSTLVDVPTVIGFLAPVVLLPASALAGLTPQQIEAILAHELAHIRRHDYLVNLLQTLVETVLFYHPAVWWLSRRIRIERENCCDDLAVSLCGDPVAYATALADLEALRSSGPAPERHIVLAATGGSLMNRIRRLLGAPSSHSGRGPAWLAGTVALLLVGGIAAGADIPRQARPSEAVTAPDSPAPDAHVNTTAPAVAAQPTPSAVAALPVGALAMASTSQSNSISISHEANDSHGNWIWSNNGERLEVTYSGTFEFTDDDTDVRQMSAGGSLKISDGRWLGRHAVEIRERGGTLERRYYVNAAERPYEPQGREWLRQNLPRFVRNTGMGAEARVARLLKNGGPPAVLTEIGRIETAYVKGIYFRQLLRQAALTPEQYRQTMAEASRDMNGSSYELAQLLIAVSDKLSNDEASRAAYFHAASGIHSNYELRRVYSTMLKRGPVSPEILGEILSGAKSIDSDHDLSELLRLILSQQPLDERNRPAFFAAVSTIHGAYERHRVLSAVVRGDQPTAQSILQDALAASTAHKSDYETATFLLEVLRQNSVEGAVGATFFRAVNTINGQYERGRVLQAVVRKSGTSNDTLRAVLESARGLDGYELSQLLQLVARTVTMTGDLRDAYLAAADRLGSHQQTQALAALVRSDRRR
jgi:beta-lactamase regulating signal transducer with metallopeptidase domain